MAYADVMSALYGRLVASSYGEFDAFRRSAEKWASIEACNKKALDAFKLLVRFCFSTASSSTSAATNSTAADVADVLLSHTGADKDYAKQVFDRLRDVEKISAFLDVDPRSGIPYGESIPDTIRCALVGCKVGVVMLTPDFVAKKWPVFEWFMLEARAELSNNNEKFASQFRLLRDVCARPDSVRWSKLGWPETAAGTATVWLDVLQYLPLLRKLSTRVVDLHSDKIEARSAHGNEVARIIRDIKAGKLALSSRNNDARILVFSLINFCALPSNRELGRRRGVNHHAIGFHRSTRMRVAV